MGKQDERLLDLGLELASYVILSFIIAFVGSVVGVSILGLGSLVLWYLR